MNSVQTHNQPHLDAVLSWLAAGMVAFSCTFLGLIAGRFVEPFGSMFSALGVEQPFFAGIMTVVPLISVLYLPLFVLIGKLARTK